MRTANPTVAFVLALLAIVVGGVGGPWICVLDNCCDDLVCTDAACLHCTCATSILVSVDTRSLPQWFQTGRVSLEDESGSPPEPAFAFYRPPRFSLA